MSKAILVIELDDEWLDRIGITCDDMLADVIVYKKESLEKQCDYSQRLARFWCPLKPLGRKVEEYGLETWNTSVGTILSEKGLFDFIYGDDDE